MLQACSADLTSQCCELHIPKGAKAWSAEASSQVFFFLFDFCAEYRDYIS